MATRTFREREREREKKQQQQSRVFFDVIFDVFILTWMTEKELKRVKTKETNFVGRKT